MCVKTMRPHPQILPNREALTAEAQYGDPRVQEVFEVE